MQLRRPALADPTAPLPAANAVAKLGAAAVTMLVALVSRDPFTPAILLIGLGLAMTQSGMRPAALARLVGPLLIAATLLGALNGLLAGTPVGSSPGTVGDRFEIGLAVGLRIAAIALAGSLALATTDPADLAAGLIAHLHVPARLAVGALASLRLVPILGGELQTIRLARRARGVDAGRDPVAAVRLMLGALVALLVSAIRRSSRMAVAMDARGFDSRRPRTLARPPRMRTRDWLLLAASASLGVAAVAISLALGRWTSIFG
ncbi:MAG: energy-coupling factor transporter transmembrane component T family protein [Candidatus Limnocylindria bacterium]